MSDPQRLRDLADLDIDMTTEERQLCRDAAAEIERLREAFRHVADERDMRSEEYDSAAAEIERLRARIAELEAALKPFAVIGRMLLASDFQDHELARGGIPAGDYRAAAAAIGGEL